MIVNKCDNCSVQFAEGEFPAWMQITGANGVVLVGPGRSVVKYPVLDFCTPQCAAEFLDSLAEAMRGSSCPSKSEESK